MRPTVGYVVVRRREGVAKIMELSFHTDPNISPRILRSYTTYPATPVNADGTPDDVTRSLYAIAEIVLTEDSEWR